MTKRLAAESARVKARLAGLFYLLTAVTAVFTMFFVLGRLVVPGNAAATAHNILTHEPLFTLGFAAALINVACQVVLAALFYDLFTPVNRTLSLLAAFFLQNWARKLLVSIRSCMAPLDSDIDDARHYW